MNKTPRQFYETQCHSSLALFLNEAIDHLPHKAFYPATKNTGTGIDELASTMSHINKFVFHCELFDIDHAAEKLARVNMVLSSVMAVLVEVQDRINTCGMGESDE